jgi:hypothetical protein
MRPATFSYEGKSYDLSHTFPKTFQAKTKGRPVGVNVKVALSCHCFTLKANADSGETPDYQFENEIRWFCPNRFEDSKTIHGHFDYALQRASTFNVSWTKDSSGNVNYLTIDVPEDGYRYCMYFDVGLSKDRPGCEVFLIIRSAYRQQIALKGRDHVRLGTLIDATLGIRPAGKRRKRRKK